MLQSSQKLEVRKFPTCDHRAFQVLKVKSKAETDPDELFLVHSTELSAVLRNKTHKERCTR